MTPATRISQQQQADGEGRGRAHRRGGYRSRRNVTGDDTARRTPRRRRRTAASTTGVAGRQVPSSAAAERRSKASAYMPVGVEHQPDRARYRSRRTIVASVGRPRARHRSTPPSTSTPSGELLGADVQLAVAEPVDPQHLGAHAVGLVARRAATMPGISRPASIERAELGQVDAVAQVGGRRGEHVATGERRAGRRELVLGVGQHDGAAGAAGHGDRRRQQAVVGPDQHALAVGDLDRHRLPRRADARVDDRQHDAVGHVRDRTGPAPGAAADVERPDAVGQVDDHRVRRQVAHDRLDHADELVVEPVVREERHGVVAAGHASEPIPGRERGPVPTPRWHQPRRRCQGRDPVQPVVSTSVTIGRDSR